MHDYNCTLHIICHLNVQAWRRCSGLCFTNTSLYINTFINYVKPLKEANLVPRLYNFVIDQYKNIYYKVLDGFTTALYSG